MPGFSGELDGALGNPEQEQRWRTEQFANARADLVRQLMRHRQDTEPTTGESTADTETTD